MIYKVTHLTSVHPRYDTRIFHKMCLSLLAQDSLQVNLVVADGKGDEIVSGLQIFDVGVGNGKIIDRITKVVNKVFRKAEELDSDIYHLHDPELIFIGLKLLNRGKLVIFDSHEDLPKQILGKHYLPFFAKFSLSLIIPFFEKIFLKRYSGIIAATPYIRDKFLKINSNTIDINNFPIIQDSFVPHRWKDKDREICYVGGIDRSRGIYEIVESLKFIDGIVLNLAGNFKQEEDRVSLMNQFTWPMVVEHGYLSKDEVNLIYQRSKIGLVTLHPQSNYIESLPVKLFEYMEAGLPIVASDFPIWRKIIEEADCGICVDPLNPKQISEAITFLLENDDCARNMGENGRRVILEKFNWDIERKKLLNFYEHLLSV